MFRLNKSWFPIFLLGYVFCTLKVVAQSNEKVKLIEKKSKKRIELFAENITDKDQDIFFMVKGTGFRRSSSRPVLKRIPAKDTVHIITLIPLVGKEQKYDYTLIVQDEAQDISIRKDHDPIKLKLPMGLVIFTAKNDSVSAEIVSYLKKTKQDFKEIDFNNGHIYRKMLNNHLLVLGIEKDSIKAPIVSYNQNIIFDIRSMTIFKSKLNELLGN